MPIYSIFDGEEKRQPGDETLLQGELFAPPKEAQEEKGHLISTILARLMFFFLLIMDLLWCVFSAARLILTLVAALFLGRLFPSLRYQITKSFLALKRSLVCAISLIVALFSPALGVMFACTYFLMYDKAGIEEVVPSILQTQFKEFFAPISSSM